MKKLLITGAAGGLGQLLLEPLDQLADSLRLTDIVDASDRAQGHEFIRGDLADAAFVDAAVAGCDGILHLGGISVEDQFEKILSANIAGLNNLYAAAQRHGQPRIIFASSNHTIGFHPSGATLDVRSPTRPDSFYGVSKCFGESLASMYFEKTGQQTASVRIGSCVTKPLDIRMLSTWLSPRDFIALIARIFAVDNLGCPIIYGASANGQGWWDNSHVDWLGWHPQDDGEAFRSEIEARTNAADRAELLIHQGGRFVTAPLPHSSQD